MSGKPIAMRDAFLTRLRDRMADDNSIFLLTADFGSPIIDSIRSDYSERFINVGIAEQNLINVAAGLALEGYNVFAYAIAPFITMRCFEQIRINLCLLSRVRRMSVTLIGVGAGYSYVVSGPTHQCYEDISIMRTLPNVRVLSPSDHICAAEMFEECHEPDIRYLRLDAQVLPVINEAKSDRRGIRSLSGKNGQVAIVSTGYMTHTAVEVAQQLKKHDITCAINDIWDLSCFDADCLAAHLKGKQMVVTLEEGFIGRGGLDAVISTLLRGQKMQTPLLSIGVPPAFKFELGSRIELHRDAGIDSTSCAARIIRGLENNAGVSP